MNRHFSPVLFISDTPVVIQYLVSHDGQLQNMIALIEKNVYLHQTFHFKINIYSKFHSPLWNLFFYQCCKLIYGKFWNGSLGSSQYKVEVWLRYIDDTFIIWPYIHFTMELECNQCLPFLDVLVSSQPSGRLGHLVHQKLTHADRYFHPSSHHHQTQKIFVINSLVQRVITLLEQTNLDQEICQE